MPITRDKTRERLLDKANNLVEEIKEYKVNGGENPIRDRLVLESLENLQTLIVMLFEDLHNSLPVSADIEILKKHDIIGWVTNNKILAALLFIERSRREAHFPSRSYQLLGSPLKLPWDFPRFPNWHPPRP